MCLGCMSEQKRQRSLAPVELALGGTQTVTIRRELGSRVLEGSDAVESGGKAAQGKK